MRLIILCLCALTTQLSFAQNPPTPPETLSNCEDPKAPQTTDASFNADGVAAGKTVTLEVTANNNNESITCGNNANSFDGSSAGTVFTTQAGIVNFKQASILKALGFCQNTQNPKIERATICAWQAGGQQEGWKATFEIDLNEKKVTTENINSGNGRIGFDLLVEGTNNTASLTYEVCLNKDKSKLDAMSDTATCDGDLKKDFTSTRISIAGLDNGNTYYFRAKVSGSSSLNKWSEIGQAEPVETFGFARTYDGAENPVSWGCAQGSADSNSWVIFAGLALALIIIRRKLKGSSALFGLLVIFAASDSLMAHPGQMNFGIIGSVYEPNLNGSTKDDGSNAFPFYKCMFENKMLPLMGIELDWHLLDKFGSLQLGFGTSYTYGSGKALKAKTADCQRSGDDVGMHLLQIRPQLTYMLDRWVDTVPLVPYLRAAIVSQGYVFTYQDGWDKEKDSSAKPNGIIFGYELGAGLMLSLNWTEPSVARNAKANDVYNRVYLKTEVAYAPLNNFHSKGLEFSSNWPAKGFPLLLKFGIVFEFN